MISKNPKISVLIVSYNVKQYIVHCIDSIQKSSYNGDIEIVVVDNNSFDNSLSEVKSKFSDIVAIQNNTNKGFGKAVNQAAQKATGEFYLVLNPDTIIEENSISTFVDYLVQNEHVGMVGPKIVNSDGSLQKGCKRSFPTISVALPRILGLDKLFPNSKWAGKYNLNYLDANSIHKVDAISGSCMFVRSDLYNTIGGFDEQFFMFGEDLDICYQIYKQGFEIHYLPSTQIMHYQGESVKSAPFDSLNAFYNAMILFSDKHFSKSKGLATRVFIRTGIFIRRFISLITNKRSQILSVLFDGLAVLIAFLIAFPLRLNSLDAFIVSRGMIPGVYILFWILVCAFFQLYSKYILSYTRAILASLTGFVLAALFTFFFNQYAFSRLVIIVATMIITVLIPGWRILAHYLMSKGVLKQTKEKHHVLFTRKTIIVGTDVEAQKISKNVQNRFDTGLDIVGYVDKKLKIEPETLNAPFLGVINDIPMIIRTKGINELIFSTDSFSNKEILEIMDNTKELHLTYRMVPRNQEVLLGKASVEDVGDYSFVNIEYTLYHRVHRITKRMFDLVLASALSILFLPLTLLMLLFGKVGKTEFWGMDGHKIVTYSTKKGRGLSQFILSLISIIRNDISFVGSILVGTNESDPNLICKPGITGLAYIRKTKINKSDLSTLDHYYVQNQSLTLDLEILIKSIFNK